MVLIVYHLSFCTFKKIAELLDYKIQLKNNELLLLSSSLSMYIWIKEIGSGERAQQFKCLLLFQGSQLQFLPWTLSLSLSLSLTHTHTHTHIHTGTHSCFQKNFLHERSQHDLLNYGPYSVLGNCTVTFCVIFLSLFLLLMWPQPCIWASLNTWACVESRAWSSHCGF